MARTTEIAVKEVLETSLGSAQILAFIADASLWVTEELGGHGLGAARLEVIERYLACAFIRLRDLGVTAAAFGDANEKYQVDPEVTDYLLRAAAMDPTGTVRSAFLAPKTARGRGNFRVGTGFFDEENV